MNRSRHKVIVDKRYLKHILVGEINYGEALACLVENSLKAFEKKINESECCKVTIGISENLIYVSDYSGGIPSDVSDEDVFKIKETQGRGIKKAIFKLGNEISINSKAEYGTRNLYLDFNANGEELVFESDEALSSFESDEINDNFGTKIFISKLDEKTLKDIESGEFLENIEKELSKIFGKKIASNKLRVIIKHLGQKDRVICPYIMQGDFIGEKYFKELDVAIKLYKKSESEEKGVDLYVDDYLIYNRVDFVKVVMSNYSFKNYVAEIISYKELEEVLNMEKDIKNNLDSYIRENSKHFKAKMKGIQYEVEMDKADELMEYYDLNTAKALGEKSFEVLYNKYKEEVKKN